MVDVSYDGERGVIFTLTGDFCFEEVTEAFEPLFEDPRFAKVRYFLIDRSETVGYEMPMDHLNILLDLCSRLSKINSSLVHLFVSGSDLQYGMSRMFEVYEEKTGWRVFNFRSRDEAATWIGRNID